MKQEVGLPPDVWMPFEQACRETIRTGQETSLEFEYRNRCFRSRIVPELARDGSIESLMGITEDITARKRAEEELARSEERYRSVVEATSDVIWTSAGNGDFVAPQHSWEAYTGQPWEEHKGGGWLEMVHPDDRAGLLEMWNEAVSRREIYRSAGRLWNAATNEYRFYTVRAVPLFNKDGTVREWIGTVTDIHERRRAAQEREQLLANEREARRDAEDAVHARDELLAIVSHDLKNPLTAIKGYSQLLRRRLAMMDPRSGERLEQVISRIDESSNKMNHLLNDLLDFGRLQAGQALTLQRRPTNLAELARSAAVEYRRTTTEHRIVVEVGDEPVIGRWDATRLEQVAANLLSNAIKYSPHGGTITLHVWKTSPGDPAITGVEGEQSQGEWAILSVRDEGLGIAESELPHIFEWYRRAKNVSGRISGAGIGLASAKYIVTQHGGDIIVTSERDVGSTFTVRLPI
jgi:PAS domain S-box-containing protein